MRWIKALAAWLSEGGTGQVTKLCGDNTAPRNRCRYVGGCVGCVYTPRNK